MIRASLLLAIVVTLMASARAFVGTSDPPYGSGVALAFGFLVLAASMAGDIVASLKLPKLTGYLLLGIACGPATTGLLTPSMIDRLGLINGIAVGLIALAAGGEINIKELRPRLRFVGTATVFAVPSAIVACAGVLLALANRLEFFGPMTWFQRVAAALLLGTVLASLSPAVVLALLTELRAAGPFASSTLGVVVLGEILIVLCFTGSHALAVAAFGAGGDGAMNPAVGLLIELGGSTLAGIAAGSVLALYIRRVGKQIPLFVVALCLVIAQVGTRLHLDVVILCITAGLVLENAFDVKGHVLARELEPATVPIFAVFFSLAGARLDLSVLRALWPLALVIGVVRAAALSAGSFVALRRVPAEPVVRRFLVAGLLPQGGVSVGLANMIAEHFSGWGRGASGLALAVIALNQIVGPILMRLAVVSSGEAGAREADSHEAPHDGGDAASSTPPAAHSAAQSAAQSVDPR
jgi:Kef-type K+ transport system membrane component KefB